jgi:HK97 family phage portal protein
VKFTDRVRNAIKGFQSRGIYYAWTGEDNFWRDLFPRAEAKSGVQITPEIAAGIGVVYACIYKISSTVAMLPLQLTDERGGRYREVRNTAYSLMNISPDGQITAYMLRETVIAFMLLYGRGFIEIIRDQNGMPVRLYHHNSAMVNPRYEDGRRWYIVTEDTRGNATERMVGYENMIDIKYLMQASPVMVNKDTIGLLKAAQDYASTFFQSGGVMQGLLSSEGNLTPEQMQTLADSWEKQKGAKTRVVPFGVKYTRQSVDPDGAQNMEARKFQAEEVCRVFNVPPAMVGITGSSYKDFENQSKHFATHTIAPICARFEAELNLKLVPFADQGALIWRHDMAELMRGDMKSWAEYVDKMLKNGVFNRNEVRKWERLNPIDGGEIYTVQVNQIALNHFEDYSEKIATQSEAAPVNDEPADDVNDDNDENTDDDDDAE